MAPLIVLSAVLFLVRLWAAGHVGFGDSEALYASWAAQPQPAYLDHPGLVGVVARAIGEGGIPSPARVHVVTSALATAVPWLVYAVARLAGGDRRRAMIAAAVTALVPEIAVGLFALTPDLLLAPLWLGAVGLAMFGLRGDTPRRAAALLAAGLLAGVAASAKVSGVLLMASLAVVYALSSRSKKDPVASRMARSIWPWAGLAAGCIVILPIVLYEARLGSPMLRHRFVDTQRGAGIALANLGALAGGQLLYLSPVLAWLAVVHGKDLVARRSEDDVVTRVLFWTFALPLVPLVLLSIWSPVAEPHWIAPALLALPIHAARRPAASARLVRAGAIVAAVLTAAAHAWVLIPASAQLLPQSVDPKVDIASELYGWESAAKTVREQMQRAATPDDPEGIEVVVVGPHWTVCAQLKAALGAGARVGCATPIPDDFDRWLPRDVWRHAENVLYVTDNRFPGDGADQLPAHVRLTAARVRVLRGGRTARVFEMYLYGPMQRALH